MVGLFRIFVERLSGRVKPRIWRAKGSVAGCWGGGFSRLDSRYGLARRILLGGGTKCPKMSRGEATLGHFPA